MGRESTRSDVGCAAPGLSDVIRAGAPVVVEGGCDQPQANGGYLTVTVIFFMTTFPPDMAGRSASATLGNS